MKIVFNKKIVIWTLVAAVIVTAITLGLVFGLKSHNDGSTRGISAIVSNGKGCADVGGTMLEDGGSAVDAAIATLLCEGVILPHNMGIGGGFVATIYTKSTGKFETLVARESAPAAAYESMFVGQTSVTGAMSGAVPGEILGYWEMHQKYGRLPWKTLFQPSIKLCREGHWVSGYLASAISSKGEIIRNEPSLSEIFMKENGEFYKEGEYMKRPQLGDTLEKIANNGADIMYKGGEVGKMFVEDIQAMGGIITEADLMNYKVRWEMDDHITAKISGGYTLYTTPLPTSGVLLSFILNVMREMYTDNENFYWQRIIETFKHAYGQRTNLGDVLNEPEMKADIEETFNRLVSQNFTEHVRTLIHDNETSTDYKYYGANFTTKEDHGTANMAVLTANGDAVTVTSTINNHFGGKVRSRRTGIILNDEMDDFSTPGVVNSFGVPASPANYIKPGKRPMSSMCPAIIVDHNGNVRLLVGAAGGTKITTSVAMTIIKYLILNESLDESVNGGRMHHQLAPMLIDIEFEVKESIRNYLQQVGHELNVLKEGSGFTALTAIGMRDGVPEPFFDRRRQGSVTTVQAKNKMQH